MGADPNGVSRLFTRGVGSQSDADCVAATFLSDAFFTCRFLVLMARTPVPVAFWT